MSNLHYTWYDHGRPVVVPIRAPKPTSMDKSQAALLDRFKRCNQCKQAGAHAPPSGSPLPPYFWKVCGNCGTYFRTRSVVTDVFDEENVPTTVIGHDNPIHPQPNDSPSSFADIERGYLMSIRVEVLKTVLLRLQTTLQLPSSTEPQLSAIEERLGHLLLELGEHRALLATIGFDHELQVLNIADHGKFYDTVVGIRNRERNHNFLLAATHRRQQELDREEHDDHP